MSTLFFARVLQVLLLGIWAISSPSQAKAQPLGEAVEIPSQAVAPQGEAPPVEAAPNETSSVETAPGDAGAPEQTRAPPSSGTRIVVIGDFLADGLGSSLAEALAFADGVEVVKRVKGPSGFVRDDFHDWKKAVRDIVAEIDVSAAVVFIGANDRQNMQTASGRHRVLSDAWRAEYAARVGDVLEVLKGAGAAVYWIGAPPVAGKGGSDMAALNELFRERVTAAGATFIDIWNAFVDSEGRFSATGPDLDGAIKRLRANDGINFTRAGYEKIAHFVEEELREDFALASIDAVAAVPTAPGDASGAVPKQLGAPSEETLLLGPATAPLMGSDTIFAPQELATVVRPIPGPVVPLTGAGVGEQKLLDGSEGDDARIPRASISAPGRIDDFSWPAPARGR